MSPTLGTTVLFAVLTNEPAQSFVAAGAGPVGDAVIQPTPYPGGFRAATVVGIVGDGKAGRVALLVYKQPGDPFRGEQDAVSQRIGDVPYSAKGVPGTWLTQKDADALPVPKPAASLTSVAALAKTDETASAKGKPHSGSKSKPAPKPKAPLAPADAAEKAAAVS